MNKWWLRMRMLSGTEYTTQTHALHIRMNLKIDLANFLIFVLNGYIFSQLHCSTNCYQRNENEAQLLQAAGVASLKLSTQIAKYACLPRTSAQTC